MHFDIWNTLNNKLMCGVVWLSVSAKRVGGVVSNTGTLRSVLGSKDSLSDLHKGNDAHIIKCLNWQSVSVYSHWIWTNVPRHIVVNLCMSSLLLPPPPSVHHHHHPDVLLNLWYVFTLKIHPQYAAIRGCRCRGAINMKTNGGGLFYPPKCFSHCRQLRLTHRRSALKVKEPALPKAALCDWLHYRSCVYWFNFIKAAA